MTWGMVAGAAVSVIGGSLLGGGGSGGSSSKQTQVYDPYAPYRAAAAQQLNSLMSNPNQITSMPVYQAMMQAAGRQSAAQGYNGSGNALVAAANAGGSAYQQQFNDLVTLSGAGQSPANAMGAANQQADYEQQQNNQMWGQIGGIVGNVVGNINGGSSGTTQITPQQIDPMQINAPNVSMPMAPVSSYDFGG